MFKLTQTSSVHDYYVQFTTLANKVHGITSDALLDCFIGSLNPDLRRDVIAQAPTTLIHSVSLAKLYKDKYKSIVEPFNLGYIHKSHPTHTPQSLKTTNLPPL